MRRDADIIEVGGMQPPNPPAPPVGRSSVPAPPAGSGERWPIAFSFPTWVCRGCHQHVEWRDAVVTDEPDLFCVRHASCPGEPQ